VRIGDRFNLNIESVAFGGQGVGRVDKFVIFVPFAALDDVLEIEIYEIKKKFARGRILKIISASSGRTDPLCRYYGRCGGCNYQHILYDDQLKIKTKQVEEIFQKIGRFAIPPVAKAIASPTAYSYRGKAQLHCAQTRRGGKTGFLDFSGSKIVDIDRCEIMEETINEKIRLFRNNQILADNTDDLIIWSQTFPPDLEDEGSVARLVMGRKFQAARRGFFQTNLYLTDRLVNEVCRLAGNEKINTVIDAYCGSGLFSIFLAPSADRVIGIELNTESIRYARINAANYGVQNVKFISGDIDEVLPAKNMLPTDGIDLIVLDPPRTGCSKEVLAEIVARKPRKVIYVSCNPATQTRDCRLLNENGYNILELLPLDMFPQTQHIEVLGLLSRK
jgi:tRNA/tmRNA/rRNA uracil-C5-methylase (TrmA/RlmC/RlmD family)